MNRPRGYGPNKPHNYRDQGNNDRMERERPKQQPNTSSGNAPSISPTAMNSTNTSNSTITNSSPSSRDGAKYSTGSMRRDQDDFSRLVKLRI